MWIFRAWITTKDGEKIYAKDHGKRAFRFWVGPGPEPTKKNQVIKRGTFASWSTSDFKKGVIGMAKTKSSVRGTQNKKIVVVKLYTKSNGTKVSGHRRSTPNQYEE